MCTDTDGVAPGAASIEAQFWMLLLPCCCTISSLLVSLLAHETKRRQQASWPVRSGFSNTDSRMAQSRTHLRQVARGGAISGRFALFFSSLQRWKTGRPYVVRQACTVRCQCKDVRGNDWFESWDNSGLMIDKGVRSMNF